MSTPSVPTTARPYFGSESRIVCPPARIAPALRTCESAAAKIAESISIGNCSGKAAMESARIGAPPKGPTLERTFEQRRLFLRRIGVVDAGSGLVAD